MRQLRMSGSVGALGERSPGATRQATSVSDQRWGIGIAPPAVCERRATVRFLMA